MLSLTLATLIGVNYAYTYYPSKLNFIDAKARCEELGTTLAVILDNTHRSLALAAINNREAPYIGLEDDGTSTNGHGSFSYPSQPEDCPLDNGECVSFWINGDGKHVCLGQGGKPCTTYHPEALFGNGAVSNMDACTVTRPYLCNDPPIDENGSCEDDEGFICDGRQPIECDNSCFCILATDTDSTKCAHLPSPSCDGYSECSTDGDCGTDEYCSTASCCTVWAGMAGICLSDCDTTRRRLEGEDETSEAQLNLACSVFTHTGDCDDSPGAKVGSVLIDAVHSETGENKEIKVYNLNIYQIYEMISLTALITFICSVCMFGSAYWCCVKRKQVHNDRKGGNMKSKYDPVSEASEEERECL